MSGPPRNACVARGVLTAAGNFTVYTIPAAHILLLKSIYLYNSGSTALTTSYWFITTGSAIYVQMFLPSLAATTGTNVQTWAALNPTDQLAIGTNAGTLNYWVSGALLPTQQQFTAQMAGGAVAGETPSQQGLQPLPLPPGTRGEPTPILLPPPESIVSPAQSSRVKGAQRRASRGNP